MAVTEDDKQRLRLTSDVGQAASVFPMTPVPATADYLATFQFEVKSLDGAAPADGFVFVAQTAGADKVGNGGGGLGFDGTAFGSRSYGVEFNSYSGQGLGDGVDQTVAWNAFGRRIKFDQKPFEHVDLGVFTAEVRVSPTQMTVTVSGGNDNMAPKVVMQTTPLAPEIADLPLFSILAPAPTFFGFTAGTGGLGQITDVYNLRIVSPAPAPTAGS